MAEITRGYAMKMVKRLQTFSFKTFAFMLSEEFQPGTFSSKEVCVIKRKIDNRGGVKLGPTPPVAKEKKKQM